MPIAIRVDRPSEAGADRLVNALAAQRLYGTPAVVVDFGTATTFDCVAGDGAYVGGAIAPGLELVGAGFEKLPHRGPHAHGLRVLDDGDEVFADLGLEELRQPARLHARLVGRRRGGARQRQPRLGAEARQPVPRVLRARREH